MFIFHKNILLSLFFLIILIACQFQEPNKNHGILFLENRSQKMIVNKSNKNDAIKIIGHPHTKSFTNNDEWIYIERVLTGGEYHKLGQKVLKDSNVLILTFNKYGILNKKIFLNKDNIAKLKFTDQVTENNLSKKSFVEKFLSSVKQKMYGNR
jgi:outer membrane protein assembly factor BamE (lipoprotein component of BamABCDE complex)